MTDEKKEDVKSDNAGGDQDDNDEANELESLKVEKTRLEAALAKVRGTSKELKARLDKLEKSDKGNATDDFKILFQESETSRKDLENKLKQRDVDEVVKARLIKATVRQEALPAAIKLINTNLLQWNDGELESVTVDAVVNQLKKDHSFLFESRVPPNTPKPVVEGSANGAIKMSRTEFDALPHVEKARVAIQPGFVVTD